MHTASVPLTACIAVDESLSARGPFEYLARLGCAIRARQSHSEFEGKVFGPKEVIACSLNLLSGSADGNVLGLQQGGEPCYGMAAAYCRALL